jgi:hypothetical protein
LVLSKLPTNYGNIGTSGKYYNLGGVFKDMELVGSCGFSISFTKKTSPSPSPQFNVHYSPSLLALVMYV